MAERVFAVEPYGVDYICDACNTGVMEQTSVFLPVDPPKWVHRCNQCGHEQALSETYPAIRYKRVPHGEVG